MNLGTFSISLAVKDLSASRAFYEQLGFAAVAGEASQGWLILRSGATNIGLFQGMFEKNMLTFNPGWGPDGAEVNPYMDIREIAARLSEQGISPVSSNVSETPSGPAHLVLVDPDGNPVLIDQHR